MASNNLSKIHIGVPTKDEIRKFFASNAGPSKRVFVESSDDSSEELNESFKAFLEQQKQKKKKPVNLEIPGIAVENSDPEIPSPMNLITPDPVDPRLTFVIKKEHTPDDASPMLNCERPSVNVTKNRPNYNFDNSPMPEEEDVNNNCAEGLNTLEKISNILSAAAEKTPQKESSAKKEDVNKSLNFGSKSRSTLAAIPSQRHNSVLNIPSPTNSFMNLHSPSIQKKYKHIASPVREYIHNSPNSSLMQKQNNKKSSSSSSRHNFRDSVNVFQQEEDKPILKYSLPMRICIQSSKVEKIRLYKSSVSEEISIMIQSKGQEDDSDEDQLLFDHAISIME